MIAILTSILLWATPALAAGKIFFGWDYMGSLEIDNCVSCTL